MLKTIAIVVVVLHAALLIFAATKPDTFRVQRATSIKAPPEEIFALINDFHSWEAWSPWEKKDPAMKRTLGAATSGKGAVYAWEGNNDVGQGLRGRSCYPEDHRRKVSETIAVRVETRPYHPKSSA